MKITIFDLLLIFLCSCLLANFFVVENLPVPDNNNNGNDILDDNPYGVEYTSEGFDYCFRTGISPNSTKSFTIQIFTKGNSADRNIIVADGCLFGYREKSFGNNTFITLNSNPLVDRTINWIEITKGPSQTMRVTVYKNSISGKESFCTFTPGTTVLDPTRKFFYVREGDVKATIQITRT